MTDPRRPAVPDRPHDVESTRVDNLATAHRPEPLRWVHRCRSCGYQGAEPPPPPCPGPSYRQTALDLGYADLMVAAGFTPNPDRPEPPGWGRGTDEYLIPPWRTHHLRRHAADLWATPLTDLREALTDLGRATIHVAYDAARAALALTPGPPMTTGHRHRIVRLPDRLTRLLRTPWSRPATTLASPHPGGSGDARTSATQPQTADPSSHPSTS